MQQKKEGKSNFSREITFSRFFNCFYFQLRYVPGFSGDGFTSLAIIYAVFSIANWFAPPVVAFIGPRLTLISGGVCYALFIAQLTYPNNYMLYGASALIGLGAAMIWVAQGNFLTLNSGPETMERNSGIFWAMLQMSLIIGNTFFYFQLRDIEQIDRATRLTVRLFFSFLVFLVKSQEHLCQRICS